MHKRQKPLRMQKDIHISPSACTNCHKVLDGATAVAETDSKRERKMMPSPGDCTVCCYCQHLMVFADDLSLRDPTDAEIVQMAADRRVLAVMDALAAVKKKKESDDAEGT